jgi:hypothetical protein
MTTDTFTKAELDEIFHAISILKKYDLDTNDTFASLAYRLPADYFHNCADVPTVHDTLVDPDKS